MMLVISPRNRPERSWTPADLTWRWSAEESEASDDDGPGGPYDTPRPAAAVVLPAVVPLSPYGFSGSFAFSSMTPLRTTKAFVSNTADDEADLAVTS